MNRKILILFALLLYGTAGANAQDWLSYKVVPHTDTVIRVVGLNYRSFGSNNVLTKDEQSSELNSQIVLSYERNLLKANFLRVGTDLGFGSYILTENLEKKMTASLVFKAGIEVCWAYSRLKLGDYVYLGGMLHYGSVAGQMWRATFYLTGRLAVDASIRVVFLGVARDITKQFGFGLTYQL